MAALTRAFGDVSVKQFTSGSDHRPAASSQHSQKRLFMGKKEILYEHRPGIQEHQARLAEHRKWESPPSAQGDKPVASQSRAPHSSRGRAPNRRSRQDWAAWSS